MGDFAIAYDDSIKPLANSVWIGRVSKGTALVKKIAAGKSENGLLVSPVDLRRVIRTE